MTIKRLTYRMQKGVPIRAPEALSVFGLKYNRPKHHLPRAGFWLAQEHQLYEILVDVKAAYKRLMKRVHPDKGGCPKLCAYVNAVNDRITFLFKRKGIQL
jgi:hypothetical protein